MVIERNGQLVAVSLYDFVWSEGRVHSDGVFIRGSWKLLETRNTKKSDSMIKGLNERLEISRDRYIPYCRISSSNCCSIYITEPIRR